MKTKKWDIADGRHQAMIEKAYSKIPAVVGQMVQYETQSEKQYFSCAVVWYEKTGKEIERNYATVSESRLLEHLDSAKKQRAEIEFDDPVLTVKRTFPSGRYNIATYIPVTA